MDIPSPRLGPDLFATQATDVFSGSIGFHITSETDGLLGFTMTLDDGRIVGVGLSRSEAQEVRHAITGWLVAEAPVGGLQ